MIDDSILFMEDNNKIEHETEKLDASTTQDKVDNSSMAEVIEENASDNSVCQKEDKEVKTEVSEVSVSEEASEEENSTETSEESADKKQAESLEEVATDEKSDKEEPIEKAESSEDAVSDDSNKSENTKETVSDDINKSEDVKEAVEPEVIEEKEASNENVEDADITQKESSEHGIVEASVDEESSEVKSEESDINKSTDEVSVVEEDSSDSISEEADVEEKEQIIEEIIIIEETQEDSSSSSTKPQAVLDELDKLKSSNHEDEAKTTDDSSEKPVNKDNEASSEVVAVVSVPSETVVMKTNTSETVVVETATSKVVPSEPVSAKTVTAEPLSAKEGDSSEKPENKDFLTPKKWYLNPDFWKSFAFDVFFLVLCVLFIFILGKKWFSMREVIIKGTSQVHSSLESGEKTTIGNINILVMGIDSVEGTHRSDTIFVLGVNPSKGKLTMLSIPRDTRVIIEGKGRKINEILPRYGEPTLRKILEDLLKINISRKVEVGFESFVGIVDAIGGVDINIEKPMHYDDNWGNLHIHFNPGMNHLDGQDALRYVRFRKDAMADLGRIKRQQDFVKAVFKKVFSPKIIVKLPSILEKAFEYIKTDFTLQEILTLAKGFDTFDVKLRALSLPGEATYIDKISYFVPYAEAAVTFGNNYFSDLAIFEIEKDYNFGKIIPKQSKSSRKNK
ncbi:MAG: LCP family protein [Candidatus Riflebacteria bacterium]|nr:LCP family protein [Candidatus Riflebacteria bacterium]